MDGTIASPMRSASTGAPGVEPGSGASAAVSEGVPSVRTGALACAGDALTVARRPATRPMAARPVME